MDPLGGETILTYDANGRLLTETDPGGHTTTYSYRVDGLLESFTINPTTTYTYDPIGNVLSVTDGNGNTTNYEYDELNRIIGVVDPLGGHRLFAYDALDNLISVTDENGNVSLYSYDHQNRLLTTTNHLGGVFSQTYDAVGNLTSVTDENGTITTFTYDGRQRVIAVVEPLGGIVNQSYDAVGNLTEVTDPLNRTTRFSYDSRRQLVEQENALNGITHFQYDAEGNLVSLEDALGRLTAYSYDALDRLASVTYADGGITLFGYDENGNQISETNPMGFQTNYAYDHLDRLIQLTTPLGDATNFTYDNVDNLTSVTDPRGNTTQFTYDANRRLVGQTDAVGQSTVYSLDPVGNLVAVTDPISNVTTFTYDALNRLTTITDQLGAVTSFGYDDVGNNTTIHDALNRSTTFTYNAARQPTSVVDPNGDAIHYDYDLVGNLLSYTDPLNQTNQFVYDDLNRLIEDIDSLGQSRSYVYDAVDNVTQLTDRNGLVRNFSYDLMDQLVQEEWIENSMSVRAIDFEYDLVGNLVAASDPDSNYAFSYDPLGRVTEVDNQGTPNLPDIVLTYSYDPVGNVTTVSDSWGVTVDSIYNDLNLVDTRTWHGAAVDDSLIRFSYDARGQFSEIQRFADAAGTLRVSRTTHQRDSVGRLTGLTHRDAMDAVMADYDYQYDLVDSLIQETHHGNTSNYQYDLADQLIDADLGSLPDESYSYDANGNRNSAGYIVGSGNRILSDGTFDYAYDAEGNLITKTEIATGIVSTFVYDHRNRLTHVEKRSNGGILLSELTFVYDVFDRLIGRIVDADGEGMGASDAKWTVYDGDHAWADFDASGTIVARYLFGDQIDQILARYRPGEGTAWYLTDRLGTVRDIIDDTGGLIDHIDFGSFGQVLYESDSAAGDRFKFTGREFEPLLGMYHYRARFYDPQLGRFISQDPLSFAAGDSNLYRYVGNDPLNAIDPYGLAATEGSTLQRFVAGTVAGVVSGIVCRGAHAFYEGHRLDDAEFWAAVGTGALEGVVFGGFVGGVVSAGLSFGFAKVAGIMSAAASQKLVVSVTVLSYGSTVYYVSREDSFGKATVAAGCAFAEVVIGSYAARFLKLGRLAGPNGSDAADPIAKSIPDGPTVVPKEAARRLGVDLNNVTIKDGVARVRNGEASKLDASDINALKDHLRRQGVTRVEVDSGLLANEKLDTFLRNRVQDGKPFRGGRVRPGDSPSSDFIIDFDL